jgi:hypothetical protein
MTDITLPRPRSGSGFLITPYLLAIAAALVLAFLLALGWSAVLSEKGQRCEPKGAFSSGFGSGFDRKRCE